MTLQQQYQFSLTPTVFHVNLAEKTYPHKQDKQVSKGRRGRGGRKEKPTGGKKKTFSEAGEMAQG